MDNNNLDYELESINEIFQQIKKYTEGDPLLDKKYLTLNINNRQVNLTIQGMIHHNTKYLESIKDILTKNNIGTVFIEYDEERLNYYKQNIIKKLRKYEIGGLIISIDLQPPKFTPDETKSEIHIVKELKEHYSNLYLIDKPFSKMCREYWENAPTNEKKFTLKYILYFDILEHPLLKPFKEIIGRTNFWIKYLEDMNQHLDEEDLHKKLIMQDRDSIMAKNIIRIIKENKNIKNGLVIIGRDHINGLIKELKKELGESIVIK